MAQFQVIFMDAGQGDSTLVVYPDNSLLLVDCGSIKNGKIISAQIEQVLKHYIPINGGKINNLVLSHPDQDHYNLVKKFFTFSGAPPVDQIYYGGALELYKNANESDATYNWLKKHGNAGPPPKVFGGVTADPILTRAGVSVYILAANASGNPKKSSSHDKNTNSITLMLVYKKIKIFLMADASEETENFIITSSKVNGISSRLKNTNGAILKMGHHGSNTSSGEDWVKAITPDGLFISSDTRTFTGTGMPTSTHLNDVVSWSNIKTLPTPHKYVYQCSDSSSPHFRNFLAQATKQVICTTLLDIKYPTPVTFETTGGSWYYTITNKGVFVTPTSS